MILQEWRLRTRNIRKMISKEKMAEMIRMCGKREKTKPNIISE